MSIILLTAKLQLTEQTDLFTSASFINDLATKFFVIGYTNSKTGPFGLIENAETWKTNLLKKYELIFQPPIEEKSIRLLESRDKQNYPIYNDGILFVGNKKCRAKAFVDFAQHINFPLKHLVIIDDKAENIESLQRELKESKITIIGFVYSYQNNTPINTEFAEVQKRVLLEQDKWIQP